MRRASSSLRREKLGFQTFDSKRRMLKFKETELWVPPVFVFFILVVGPPFFFVSVLQLLRNFFCQQFCFFVLLSWVHLQFLPRCFSFQLFYLEKNAQTHKSYLNVPYPTFSIYLFFSSFPQTSITASWHSLSINIYLCYLSENVVFYLLKLLNQGSYMFGRRPISGLKVE